MCIFHSLGPKTPPKNSSKTKQQSAEDNHEHSSKVTSVQACACEGSAKCGNYTCVWHPDGAVVDFTGDTTEIHDGTGRGAVNWA
jgi:hypothetical protein